MSEVVLSVIFGYRNRETNRIKRCLNSLLVQSYQNFEVVFVDYGSDDTYNREVETLVKNYAFVNYVYSFTKDMPWNRSHALNTGIRFAKGEYILFGDIDLIYSPNVLEELMHLANNTTQVYSKVYFLPENFNNWEGLDAINLSEFKKSTDAGRGGVHIVKKSILESINGYDEYYCFWGVEDRDLSGRIELLGIKTIWLDERKFPVYHQWHPEVSRAKKGFFPDRWWEQMNIHYQLFINKSVRNNVNAWGKFYLEEDRVVYQYPELKYQLPSTGDWMLKGKFTVELIRQIQQNPHKTIAISLSKQTIIQRKLNGLNNLLQKIVKSLVLMQDQEKYFQPYNDLLFVVWNLIKHTDLIKDYAIIDCKENVEIKLVGNV